MWDVQIKEKPVLYVSDKRASLHTVLLVLLYQNELHPTLPEHHPSEIIRVTAKTPMPEKIKKLIV